MSPARRGAVAAGSPLTVQAGLNALRHGGNAVDAAVASTLMAAVAEPLLTGLGGGGIATVRMNGRVEVWDLFANTPGLGAAPRSVPPMRTIDVNFGPTTQRFHVGPASVAVPGMALGLHALHSAHGRIPMVDLARPAVAAARQGVPVNRGFARVCELLWPILQTTDESLALFGRDGRALVEGEEFRCPALGDTIEQLAATGPALFTRGGVAQAMLDMLGHDSLITARDLEHYQPRRRPALRYRYRDATVWIPGPSSLAGLLVLQTLRALEDHGPMPAPLGAAQVRFLAHAMQRADHTRQGPLLQRLFSDGFVDGFLSALAPDEVGEELAHQPLRVPRQPGNTTHISVADEDGNAVGTTHSLGETSGLLIPGTGVRLNNFLGEDDVNPSAVQRQPGQRLMTMCCPTIVELGDQVFVLGSGGSSRIRSAILHGIVYLTDHGMHPAQVVAAPRAHCEEGTLYIEIGGRPTGTLDALGVGHSSIKRFEHPSMFFGGLHIAGVGPRGFVGAGDARRSGAFGVSE